MAKDFSWGDGKGRVHSRRKRTPRQLAKRQAQKREARKYANPIYDPTQPLSGKSLGRAADRLTDVEFGSRRSALAREDANAETQGLALVDRAGSYYSDLARTEAGDVERQRAIGERLQAALKGTRDRSTAALDASAADVDRRLGADEAVRGPGLGGGSAAAIASELAAQRAAAAADASTAQTDAAAGTADYERLSDLTARSTAARGGEIRGELLTQLANQRGERQAQRTDLESEAGAKRATNLLDLRGKSFEDLVAMEGLGIKREDLRAQIASDRADQALAGRKLRQTDKQNRRQARLERERQRTTRRGQDVSAETQRRGQAVTRRGQDMSAEQRRQDRASRERLARARRQGTQLEGADAKKLKTGIANAVADITSGDKLQIDGKTYTNPSKFLRDSGAPGIVVKAARERAHGGLNYDTAAELRRLGVRVPRNWLRGGSKYNKGKQPG